MKWVWRHFLALIFTKNFILILGVSKARDIRRSARTIRSRTHHQNGKPDESTPIRIKGSG